MKKISEQQISLIATLIDSLLFEFCGEPVGFFLMIDDHKVDGPMVISNIDIQKHEALIKYLKDFLPEKKWGASENKGHPT